MTFGAPLVFAFPLTLVPIGSTLAAAEATAELPDAVMLPPAGEPRKEATMSSI